MNGEIHIEKLIQNMRPVLNNGEYIFCTLPNSHGIDRNDIVGEFKEKEGTTIILSRQKADTLKIPYTYVAAWITLSVHSSLAATGLTAAVATALAKHDISCNVVAAYYHDHLFVPHNDAQKAISILKRLSKQTDRQ